jgi:hypothetical protein
MGKRIKIEGKQLATVIYVWLRAVPKWAWGEEPRYASLKKMKRHNPRDEPDPPQIVAELIAENLKGLDWEVSYEEQGNLFQSVGEGRKETTPPGPKE